MKKFPVDPQNIKASLTQAFEYMQDRLTKTPLVASSHWGLLDRNIFDGR